MRTNKILKAFCLSAALLLVSFTARQATAATACKANAYPNSYRCTGWVSSGPLQGPVSATLQTLICNLPSATNTCLTNNGLYTITFATGQTVTANFFAPIETYGGCTTTSPVPAAASFCPSSVPAGTAGAVGTTWSPTIVNYNDKCTKSKTPFACCTGLNAGTCISAPFAASTTETLTNAVCTKAGAPFSCCTGKATGACDNICVIVPPSNSPPGTDTCNPASQNCVPLATYASAGKGYTCPAGAVCMYSSEVSEPGVGYFQFGTDLSGNSTDLTGCSQWIQFSGNAAETAFTAGNIGPLTGTCSLAGTAITLACAGTPQS